MSSSVPVTPSALWTVGQTCWGEARNQGEAGMAAVAHVIVNRARHSGFSVGYECRKPGQFSCWNLGDPNRMAMELVTLEDTAFRIALHMAINVLGGAHADPTRGARHYFRFDLAPWPAWAQGHIPSCRIKDHLFFNDIA